MQLWGLSGGVISGKVAGSEVTCVLLERAGWNNDPLFNKRSGDGAGLLRYRVAGLLKSEILGNVICWYFRGLGINLKIGGLKCKPSPKYRRAYKF